ncbi:MAG: response regulator [bacterium]|nr:response regulator [bacterium]
MKVLIVDDSLVMRKLIVKSLKEVGFEVDPIEASDGKDALRKLDPKTVNLIISDWNMPQMDGLSFVKKVRENKDTKRIPIIMLTTEGSMAKFEEALNSGVDDYITKPFTPDKLKKKLEKVMGKS